MKTYRLQPTKHKDLFRVVDREGNWQHYFHQPTGKYLRGTTTILNEGYAKGAFLLDWLSQHTKSERDQILSAAGDRGDMVHRTIDLMLTSETEKITIERKTEIHNRATGEERHLSNEEWDAVLSFGRFWTAHEPIVVVSEATVFDLEEGYAGTLDSLLILTKECAIKTCQCKGLTGVVGLWDWKTSSGIYPSYWAQLVSYAHAGNIVEYIPANTKRIAYNAILRLGTNHKSTGGYELKVHGAEAIKDDLDAFKAAKIIANIGYKPFDPAVDIEEIPDSVELTVKKFVAEPLKVIDKKRGKSKRDDERPRSAAKAAPRGKAKGGRSKELRAENSNLFG